MSIIERTSNLELTQYDGSSVKAQLYANYNSDMQKIDLSVSQLSSSLIGVGNRVTTLEGTVVEIDAKADNAIETANTAKETADGFDTRVTTLEGKVSDLETWAGGVDTTLEAYDGRLDAIEDVIETVSTANINDLIARMDALEQKVDANTQSIDTVNDNIISAVNRIIDLETGLGTTNANLNALANRVTLLEDCCSSVRETLTDHNTRINKNANDINALDARLTRDETNIAGNASDITILATQNNTQSQQIDDLYAKYNALDPTSPTNLYSRVQTLEDVVGNTPLQTTAQTVTGAINELLGIGNNIGDLTQLKTTNKLDIVSAINELYDMINQ
jgi:chromosome segregation ATPase